MRCLLLLLLGEIVGKIAVFRYKSLYLRTGEDRTKVTMDD